MKKINKIIASVALAVGLATAGGIIVGCGNDQSQQDQEIMNIYTLAVENGYNGTYEQWLASIKGEKGDSVELRVNDGYVQWKNTGDTSWQNLVSVESLKGDKGDDATFVKHTVEFDFANIGYFFESNNVTSVSINSTQWLTNLPKVKTKYKDYQDYIGWFIKNTDKQIRDYDFIGADVVLEARYLPGLYSNGVMAKTWNEVKEDYKKYYEENSMSFEYKEDVLEGMGYNEYFSSLSGSLVIGNEIKEIGYNAFYGSENLESVILPVGLEKIGQTSFRGCANLKNITIPENVTSIENEAFAGCSSLERVVIFGNIEKLPYACFEGCSKLKQIILPGSITEIEYTVFGNCDNLEKIFYCSTESQWDSITGASTTDKGLVYFYSATQPLTAGHYWHYAADGITPIEW